MMSLWQSLVSRSPDTPLLDGARVSGDTHRGRVRKQNEDSYLYVFPPDQNAALLGVADGMGGHEGGEVASYLAMEYLISEWNQLTPGAFSSQDDVRAFLARALSRANYHIYLVNHRLKIRRAMGTTLTVGVLWKRLLLIAHAGDSRCYRVRKKKISLLTCDQNWMTEMIQTGRMTPMEAALHPLSKTLSNCIGAMQTLQVEFSATAVQEGDRYLFCSDGVFSMIDDDQIQEEMIKADSPAEAVKEMMHLALRNGGLDNISAVCLFV